MMDFISSILLWAGLGLLLIVVLFALWGFLGGLKRELTWTIVCLVLLLLAWLIFGDAATLLNSKGILVNTLKSMLPGDFTNCVSLWDVLLALGRDMLPNGEALLVEGKETYTLFYDVASGLIRGVGMIVITLVVFLITPFIRLITHIVWLIVRAVKRGKAKRAREEDVEEETPEEEPSDGEPEALTTDSVVISESDLGLGDVVVTVGENDAPAACPIRKRIWGAVVGALKGIAVIIILFAPIAGICSVVGTATPETRKAIANIVEGDKTETAAGEESMVDLAFGFVDKYYQSGIGNFVEGSAYFFGESFSTMLFDSALRVDTNGQRIVLRQELITFINAVNALDGKLSKDDLGKWTQDEVNNALDNLKDSKLIVELMPVVIEFVYEDKVLLPVNVQELLVNANQATAFLELRDINWDKDIELILDAVKEAYKLGVLDADFNYLTMDPDILLNVVDCLGDTEFVNKVLPIVINTALRMDAVTNIIGIIEKNPDLSSISWKSELIKLVEAYDLFQDLGITDLNQLNKDFLLNALDDEDKLNAIVGTLGKVVSLDLFDKVVIPVAFLYASNNDTINDYLGGAGQLAAFKELQDLDWEKEIKGYAEALKVALDLFNLNAAEGESMVDIFNLDSDVLKAVFAELFKIESFEKILAIGTNVALNLPQVKELTGGVDLGIDISTIRWQEEFDKLVDVYTEFKKLGFESMDDLKKDPKDLLIDILTSETKYTAVESILDKLAGMDLFNKVFVPIADAAAEELFKKDEWKDFANILNLSEVEVEEWKQDLKTLLNVAKEAYSLNILTLDLKQMNLTGDEDIATLKNILREILGLNVLGDDSTKSLLLTAALNKFDIIEGYPDFSKVVWADETEVLVNLLDQFARLSKLDGFDINNAEFDYKKLLNAEEIFDIVIDALDVVVDSEIVVEILPDLINKYLIPIIEEQTGDTDGVFKEIFDGISSEDLVSELKKVVSAIVDARDLGIFDVAFNDQNLSVLKYYEVDKIENIVNVILGSKIFENHEGQILRIILKLTKILDLPKGFFDEIDFTGEREIIIAFIDAFRPILTDPTYQLFNKEGKLVIDLTYLAEQQNIQVFVDAMNILFGNYEQEGTEEFNNSKLIELLLPEIYDTFVVEKGLIPDEYKEIVSILNVDNLTGSEFTYDIRRLVYVFQQLVNMNVPSFIINDEEINLEHPVLINRIIDALHEINMIKGVEGDVLVWAYDKFAKDALTNAGFNVSLTVEDFAGVNWDTETQLFKDLVNELASFLLDNGLTKTSTIKDFIDNQEFLDSPFISNENAVAILNILSDATKLQTLEIVLGVGFPVVLEKVEEAGIDVTFWKGFTGEELAEDVRSLLTIVQLAVNNLDVVNLYLNHFEGELKLEEKGADGYNKVQAVQKIIEKLFALNLIEGHETELVRSLINRFALSSLESLNLTVDDLSLETVDWTKEVKVINEVIGKFGQLIIDNKFETIASIKDFINNKEYKEAPFICDSNVIAILNIVESLTDLSMIASAERSLIEVLIEQVNNKLGLDVSFWNSLNDGELISDIKAVIEIAKLAVNNLEVVGYYLNKFDGDLNITKVGADGYDKSQALQLIVEKLFNLNLVKGFENDLLTVALNKYALSTLEGLGLTVADLNLEEVFWTNEVNVLKNVVAQLCDLANNNFTTIASVKDFAKNAEYKEAPFINDANVIAILDIVNSLADLSLIDASQKAIIDVVVQKVLDKLNLDVSFWKTLSNGDLADDIKALVEIAKLAVNNLEVVGYYLNKFDGDLNLDKIGADGINKVDALKLIIEKLFALNLVDGYEADLIRSAINRYLINTLDKYSINVNDLGLSTIDWDNEVFVLQNLVDLATDFFGYNNLLTIDNVKKFVSEKWFMDVAMIKDDNLGLVSELLRVLNKSELVANILPQALKVIPSPAFKTTADGEEVSLKVDFLKNLTNKELQADLLVLADIVDELVEFGISSLLVEKLDSEVALTEANLTHVANIINRIYDLNLVSKYDNELFAEGINFALNLFNSKLPGVNLADFTITPEDLESIDFEQEFSYIADLLPLVGKLLEDADNTTIPEVLSMVNDKEFLQETFWTDNVITDALNIVDAAVKLQLLDKLLPIALAFGMNMLEEKGIVIDFLKDYAKDQYTSEKLLDDVLTLISIVKEAINFGAVEYYFTKDIANLDLMPVSRILGLVQELHFVRDIENEWVNYLANFILKTAKLDDSISFVVEDFIDIETNEAINYDNENTFFRKVVEDLIPVLEMLDLVSLKDVMDLIANKDFMHKGYISENAEVVNNLVAILETVTKSKILQASYLELLAYGKQLVKDKFGYDISFVDPTKLELANDVKSLVAILQDVCQAGAVEYLRYEAVEKFDMNAVNDIVDRLVNLNVIKNFEAEWVVFGTNFLVPVLNLSKNVNVEDFAGVNWNQENETIKDIVAKLGDFLVANDLDGYPQVYNFYVNGTYKDYDFLSKDGNANANLLVDVLDRVVDLQILGGMLPLLVEYGINFLNDKNYQIDFFENYLNNDYTADKFNADLNTLVKIAQEAVNFGALEYVLNKDLSQIDLTPVKQIVSYLQDLNILTDIESDWVAYIANFIMKMAKLDDKLSFVATDFEAVYYKAENVIYQNLVDQLSVVLDCCEIENLQDIKDFLNDKTYTQLAYYNSNNNLVDAILDAADILTDSAIINATYLDLLAYGKDLVNTKFGYDISFLNPSQEEFAKDVKTLISLANDVVDFGALEFVAYGFVEEFNFDSLNVAVDKLFDLHVIKDYETNWALLGIDVLTTKLSINNPLTEADFANMDWTAENDTFKKIVKGLGDFLVYNNLNAYPEVVDFIKLGDYKVNDFWINNDNANINKVIDILSDVVDLQLFKACLPLLVEYGFTLLDNAGYPMVFLEEYLLNDYTSEKMSADLKTIINIAKEALEFGALEYVFEKDITNLDLSHIVKIVDYLQDLNILVDNEAELVAYIANVVMILTKLTDVATFDENQFADIDFESENFLYQKVVVAISNTLAKANLTSISGILDFVKDKVYMDYEYLDNNPELIESVLVLAETIVDSKILETSYIDLYRLAKEIAYDKGFDLSFSTPSKEELTEDIKSLTSIARDALDFGALEYMATKNIAKFDFEALKAVIEKVFNLNIIKGDENNWVVVGLTFASDKLGLATSFVADDFAAVDWNQEVNTLLAIVDKVAEFLTDNNLDSFISLNNYITSKDYNNYDFWKANDFANVDKVIAVVEKVIDLQILGPVLPLIADYAIKFITDKNLGLDFLEYYLDNDYTAPKFYDDLKVVVSIAKEAVRFGALEYVFEKDITNIDLTHIQNILGYVQDLHLVIDNESELVAYAANKIVSLAKLGNILDEEFTANDFAGINYEAENELYQTIVYELSKVLREAKLANLSEIIDFVIAKKYVDYAYLQATPALTNAVLDLVAKVSESSILGVTYLDFYGYAKGLAYDKGFDLSFSTPSTMELAEDIKALTSIARDAITFGALEYMATKDIAQFNFEVLKTIIEKVFALNIIEGDENNWLILGLDFASSKLGVDTVFTTEDFAAVNWDQEVNTLLAIVDKIAKFLVDNRLDSFSLLNNFIASKNYNEYNFWKASDFANADAAIAILEEAIKLQIIGPTLPLVTDYAIKFMNEKNLGLDFLETYFNTLYRQYKFYEDLATLLKIAKEAIHFGALEYVFEKDITNLDLTHIQKILGYVQDLHLVIDNEPELVAYAANKIVSLAKLNNIFDEFTSTEYDTVDYEAENLLYQNAVNDVAKVLNAANLTSISEIKDFINDKKYVDYAYLNSNRNLIENVLVLINNIVDSKILQSAYHDVLDYGIAFTYDKGYDIYFLNPSVEEITEDLKTLTIVARDVVEFGLLEYLDTKDIANINALTLAKVVKGIQRMNMFFDYEAKWAALAGNAIAKLAKVDSYFNFDASSFAGIDWDNENKLYVELITLINPLLNAINVTSVSDIKDLVADGNYKSLDFYTSALVKQIVRMLNVAQNAETLQACLPSAQVFGRDKALGLGYDVLFLNLNKEELVEDLHSLVSIIEDACVLAGYEYLDTRKVEEFDFVLINKIIAQIDNVNLLNQYQGEWVEFLVDFISSKNLLPVSVDASALDMINWSEENVKLQAVVTELGKFLQSNDIDRYPAITNFLTVSKDYMSTGFWTNENIDLAAEVLYKVVESGLAPIALAIGAKYGIEFADSKGFDLHFLEGLFDDASTSESYDGIYGASALKFDARRLVVIAKEAIAFGVFDIINNIDIDDLDYSHIVNIVDNLQDLYLLNFVEADWINFIVSFLGQKIGIDFEKTTADYASIDFEAENEIFKQAIRDFDALVYKANLNSISEILHFVNTKQYTNFDFYKEEYVDFAITLIDGVLDSKIIASGLNKFFDKGIEVANSKGYDISFLSNQLTNDELVEDIKTLLLIVKEAVEFGAIEYLHNKDITNLDLTHVQNILGYVQDLHLVNVDEPKLVALIANKIVALAKLGNIFSNEYLASDFASIDFESENVLFQTLVYKLSKVLVAADLTSITEIIDFVKANKFKDYEYLDENSALIDATFDFVNKATDSDILAITYVDLYAYAKEFANNKGYDISFSNPTNAELVNDIKVLVSIARDALDFGALEYLQNKDIAVVDFAIVKSIVAKLEDINILTDARGDWASLVANVVAEKVGYNKDFTTADFVSVYWPNDNAVLRNLIDLVANFYQNRGIESLSSMINYNYLGTISDALLLEVADIIDEASNATLLAAISSDLVEFADVKLDKYNLTFAKGLTGSEYVADVRTFAGIMRNLANYEAVSFYNAKFASQINYAEFDQLYSILDKVGTLNILSDDRFSTALNMVLDLLSVDVSSVDWTNVNASDEMLFAKQLLTEVKYLAIVLNVNTLADATNKDVLKAALTTNALNAKLEYVSNILGLVKDDELLSQIAFPLLDKYLPATLLPGLVDVQNIYANYGLLAQDLGALQSVINAVIDLNVPGMMDGSVDLPYNKVDTVKGLLVDLLGLHYLNDTGRVDEILGALSSYFDVSSIDGSIIDFAGDAVKLGNMYQNIAYIVANPEFPVKNVNDISGASWSLSFFKQTTIMNAIKRAINCYTETSIYDQTGLLVLVAAIPLLKTFARDYYDALDIDNLGVQKLIDDFFTIKDTVDKATALGLIASFTGGTIDMAQAKVEIPEIIDTLFGTNLLAGKEKQLLTLLVRDFVNNKVYGFVDFTHTSITTDGMDFDADLALIKDIIVNVCDLATALGVNTWIGFKAYSNVRSILDVVADEDNLDIIVNILNDIADNSLLRINALALYNATLKLMNLTGDLATFANLDFYNDNDELLADLDTVVTIVEKLNEFGVSGILYDMINNTATTAIDYEANEITDIMKLLGNTYYLANKQTDLLSFAKGKLNAKIDMSLFDETTIDLVAEMNSYIYAYKGVAAVLNRDDAPYKTVKSLIDLSKNVKSFNWQYFAEYDTGSELVTALMNLSDSNLVSELLETALYKVSTLSMDFVQFADPTGLTTAQIKQDFVNILNMAQSALDFMYNEGNHVRVGNNISIENVPAALKVLSYVWNLNLLSDTKKADLVTYTLDKFGVDVSSIDLSTIDWDNEYVQIASMLENVLNSLNNYNETDLKSAYLYAASFRRMTFAELAKELHRFAFRANPDEVVAIIKALDGSDLIDQILLPVYRSKVQSSLSSFATLADLSGYSNADLASDIHSFALIAQALLDSKLYSAYKSHTALDEVALADEAEVIVEELFGLKLLQLKKNDILALVNEKAPSLGLDTVSFTNVDFAQDGQTLALASSSIITLYNYLVINENKDTAIELIGRRELADAVEDLFNQFIATSIVEVLAPWAYNKFVGPQLESLLGSARFNNFTDTQVMDLLADISDALNAVIEIGLVGNDDRGSLVDFNNYAANDKLANLYRDNFPIPSAYVTLYRDIFDNLYKVGSFTLDYTDINLKAELSTFKSLVNKGKSLFNSYKGMISRSNFTFAAETAFQDQVDSLVGTALNSAIISQILLPVLRGAARVYSQTFGGITLFENDTVEEFNGKLVSEYLADIYDFVGYANELGVLKGKLNYKETSPMINIVDKLVVCEMTKDNISPLLIFALKKVLKVEVSTELETAIFNIDWTQEAGYIDNFLTKIEFALNVAGVRINSVASMKNNTFIGYAQQALAELEQSQVLELLGRTLVIKYIGQVVTGSLGTTLQNALNDNAYTDADFVTDYALIVEAITDIIELDVFGSGEIISKLNNVGSNGKYAIVNMVEKLFALELMKGYEDTLVNELLSKVSLLSSVVITYGFDWDTPVTGEKACLVNVVEKLADFLDAYETEFAASIDFNNLDPEKFANANVKPSVVALINSLAASQIGQQVLPSIYDSQIKPVISTQLGSDFEDIIDFNTLPTTQWGNEFGVILDIYTAAKNCISGSSITGTFADIADLFAQVFGLNSYPGITSVKNDTRHWLDVIVGMLPSAITNGITIDLDVVFDQTQAGTSAYNDAYLAEAEAYYDIIVALDNVVGGSVDSFDYASVYNQTDWTKLEEILSAIVNAKTFRTLLVKLVGDKLDDMTPNAYFDPADLLSTSFNSQYNGGVNSTFDETHWTADEVAYLAQILAMTNVIDIESLDFETVDLGKAHDDVDPSDVRSFDTTGAGLLQLLQLMNYSNTFSLAIFGGNTGILHEFLVTDQSAVSSTAVFGDMPATKAGANTEIKTIIDILDLVNTNSVLGGSISSAIGSKSSQVIYDLLTTIYSSTILGPIVPDMVEDAINANASSSGSININDLISSGFSTDNTDAIFWTNDQFAILAKLVKTANQFTSGIDFADNSSLGLTGPAYDANFATYDAGMDNVGLVQMLKLMNVSEIFDVTVLGGTGIMYDFLTSGTPAIISNADFTTLGEISTNVATANTQIDEIMDVLDTASTYGLLSSSMSSGITGKTVSEIANILKKFVASSVLKVALPYMVNDAIISNAGSGDLVVTDFVDGYGVEVGYWDIDWANAVSTDWSTYWTNDQIDILAKLVKTANAFSSGFDFADTNDLGLTGPAYDATLADYQTGLANVGLSQMLKLMNVSEIFDVTVLGGTGIMYDFLTSGSPAVISDPNFTTLGDMPTNTSLANTEIDAIINLLEVAGNYGLLSGSMSSGITGRTTSEVANILKKFVASSVLKIALPYMVNEAIISNAGSGDLVVTDFIDGYGVEVGYWDIDWSTATSTDWSTYWTNDQIDILAKLVKTANAFSSGFDFADPNDLGLTGPAYDATLTDYQTGLTNVGLVQMLKLMNVSEIFNISVLGGTGIMYEFLTSGTPAVISDPNFTTLGDMPTNTSLANTEIDAIIDLLDTAGGCGLLSGSMAGSLADQNATDINNVLTCFVASCVLKVALPYMVNSAVEANTCLSGDVILTDFFDPTYYAITDWYHATDSEWNTYWSDTDQLGYLVKLLRTANNLGNDSSNIFSVNKGDAAYTVDTDLDTYETNIDDTGLRQMLQLINHLSIFNIKVLQGSGTNSAYTPGIIDNAISGNTQLSTIVSKPLGRLASSATLSDWDTEIDNIVEAITSINTTIGSSSDSIAEVLAGASTTVISNLLDALNESIILREMLPEITYYTLKNAAIAGGASNAVATAMVDGYKSGWLTAQQPTAVQAESFNDWDDEIADICLFITTARGF